MTLTLDLHWPGTAPTPDAYFSKDRVYRYWLTRYWDHRLPGLALVGLNPSSADEHRDDHTIRRERTFAADLGYGSLTKYNLNALVSTDPDALQSHPDPVGPENDAWLAQLPQLYDVIVLAWGGHADPARARAVASMLWQGLCEHGGALAVLGWTSKGQPRHPLYLKRYTPLQCLSAGGHSDYRDLDARWAQLIADTDDVPDPPSRRGGAARNGQAVRS